ncbi:unnamed protein product [Strongylus vulgaris]|uniref:Uncharacterized protein n=1 Tax=Strongylus vulgaris TaxID=40348 RepID=A0A3P7JQ76_STRVU|nr:unnamed protein product [Strongylus vulgaris]
MYTEDSEEAAASARRQLQWFLDPCHESSTNESSSQFLENFREDHIRCDDVEILNRAGDGYVERHCHNEELPDQSPFLRRISYEDMHCSCLIKCADGTEFFRYAGCHCPHDEFFLPEAGCLDPDCIWKTDDRQRWTITNVTGSRAAFASITLPPGNGSASLYSPYYQQISIQV